MNSVAVLGAGSWGTALAIVLANNGVPTRIWGHIPEQIEAMRQTGENKQFLPGVKLPDELSYSADLAVALEGVRDVLIAVPSHAFRSVLNQLKPLLSNNARIVWATKGIDPLHKILLHEVANELLPTVPQAVLSGPSFAKEVACGLPTAVTIACEDEEFRGDLAKYFQCRNFRLYPSHDLIGVQLAGACKNVLAIAVGIADGLGFGANSRAALITRGLAEMIRLGVAMGAQAETFTSLAGVGDLILTCTDDQSRNRRFGKAMGKGMQQAEALAEIGQVVEGLGNAKEVFLIAERYGIDMPIITQVYQVLHQALPPQQAVENLLSRSVAM